MPSLEHSAGLTTELWSLKNLLLKCLNFIIIGIIFLLSIKSAAKRTEAGQKERTTSKKKKRSSRSSWPRKYVNDAEHVLEPLTSGGGETQI